MHKVNLGHQLQLLLWSQRIAYRANLSIMSAREMSCITSFSDLRIRREENQPSSHSKEQLSCKHFARYLFFTMRTGAYSVQPCSRFVDPDMIDEEV